VSRRVPGLAAGTALAALSLGIAATGAPAEPGAAPAATEQVIGYSVRGRPIRAVQLGDPLADRVALIVGVIHGDERVGLRIVDRIRSEAEALVGVQLWVIPSANPDGARARTRKNAHGVDLNRNFPYRWRGDMPRSSGYYPGPSPASEPETRAVMAFVAAVQPDLSVWFHQPWGAVLACRGRPEIAVRYAKLVRMRTSCRGKGLRGTAITWENATLPGSSAFVVELPADPIRGRAVRRHARAAIAIAEAG
jgi:protein MpaA